MDLLAEIEKMKTANEEEKAALMVKSEEHANSIDSQRLYDLEARLTTSEADKAVAQQDAERLQRDLDALEGVLHQFQVDSKAQKERVAAVEVELEQAKKELQTRQPLPEPSEGETNDLERVMEKLAKKTHECAQLREVRTELRFLWGSWFVKLTMLDCRMLCIRTGTRKHSNTIQLRA